MPAATGKLLHGVAPKKLKKKMLLGGDPTSEGSGAGAWPNMLYQGGPVIHNPNVYVVFVGDWTSAANQTRATRLAQFVTDLLNSSFMNILSQYGVGSTGTVAGSVFLAEATTSLTHSDLVTLLQNAINSNSLPEPAGSDCYILYLADNLAVNDTVTGAVMCEASSDNAFGYHTFFTTTAGNPFYFAIIPGLTDTCLSNSCPMGNSGCNLQTTQTQEQRQTGISSHELSEMFSDPQITGTIAASKLAWYDPVDINGFSAAGEIGDVCAGNYGTITVGPNAWTVQLMYSKLDDQETNGSPSCVNSESFPLPSLLPAISLILDRSTFGKDEVSAVLSSSPTDVFQDALYVVVDGYTPDELGLTSSTLTSPPNLPTFSGSFAALGDPSIKFDTATGVQLDQPGKWWNIQRITFPFNIVFSSLGAFSNLSAQNPSQIYGLSVSITNTVTASGYPTVTAGPSFTAELELVFQADPFMDAGETWWLSNDIRVFKFAPAELPASNIPLQFSSTAYTGNANNYIKALIGELNTSFTDPSTVNTPFSGISPDEDQSALNLTGTDVSGNPVLNFALARVHLKGDTANNVRCFFRLFISSSPDTDFNTTTTFRSAVETDSGGNPIPGTLIPLLGFIDSDMSSTIPFFAEPRIDASTEAMSRQTDPTNVQTIPSPSAPAPATGAEVYAYFGSWLDLNQFTPQFPINPASQPNPDGPYATAAQQSIQNLIMSNHACIVAQIAYDPDPIPAGANAATSDKIGQRNISWSSSDNPGAPAGHLVPTLFDLKFTSPNIGQNALPDELMIEWGDTPVGSTASIFWPQVSADDVIQLANRFYTSPTLTKQDAHTVQVNTGSVTYIPIPAGTGPNLAGLVSVQLPSNTVKVGQEFNIVVRRLRSKTFGDDNRDFAGKPSIGWRYVVGAFQIRIPVSTGKLLLPEEESLLALFKWKLDSIPTNNRWHPVLKRFVHQISGRVNAWGGNAGSIPPSPLGYPGPITKGTGHPPKHPHDHPLEFTGKVAGVIYDIFGDFDGFLLLTDLGHEHRFHAREANIEDLAREAWEERSVISVFADHKHPEEPLSIVLRRTPRPI